MARARSRVLQACANVVPMVNRKTVVPKWTGDPTAAWHTENDTITTSDATLGSVELVAQSLADLTVASRELIEGAPGVERELMDAFAAQFALTVDHAALYGSGTDPEPQGIAGAAGVTTQEDGSGNGETPDGFDWLIDAFGALQDANETPNGVILEPPVPSPPSRNS